MEAAMNTTNGYTSVGFVLTEDPNPITQISESLGRVLKEDLLSRLPDLPRETQLSLRDMFSADLWNYLTSEQRRNVATTIHYMTSNVVHLLPSGRGADTTISIYDCSSPSAEMAKEAAYEWMVSDELHQEIGRQVMKKLLAARNEINGPSDLDYLIEVIAMDDKQNTSEI